MLFLIFSNIDIQFAKKKLTQRSNTLTNALPTAKLVELIDKNDFAKVALDKNSETFVLDVVAVEALLVGMTIYPSQVAQITGGDLVQIAALQ